MVNGVTQIDHNSNQATCNETGGRWANGTVEDASWVKTDPNSDVVHIWSHYKDIVGETWAGPGWSHGDKYANVIPQVQARDQSLDYQLRMWGALAVMHGPGGLPGEGDTGSPVEDLPRTGSALKKDLYHAFPDEVDNSAGAGTATQLRPGVTLYQVEGSYKGVEGRFEWIVDNGNVTHRMFVPGGTANGIPIKP